MSAVEGLIDCVNVQAAAGVLVQLIQVQSEILLSEHLNSNSMHLENQFQADLISRASFQHHMPSRHYNIHLLEYYLMKSGGV